MWRDRIICFICLVYLCFCIGLSFSEGSDIVKSHDAEHSTPLLDGDPKMNDGTLKLISATPGFSPKSAGGNLSISGMVFNDLNGTGLRTKETIGLPGWTIVLSRDMNEILQTTTDYEGLYSFKNLTPGRYIVVENMIDGWNQTCPGEEKGEANYTINLVDEDAINYNFGNIFGPVTYVPQRHPIMSKNAWNQRTQAIKNLPKAGTNTQGRAGVIYPSSFSLLSHIPYTASQRDQGSCGNCWVWGCTAPIEVAHDIQNGVHDRLSIQYLNSNYNGGSGSSWACCGGWEVGFQNFYSTKGNFIPWSNSNANFRDGGRSCSAGTSVPASSISTSPSYSITSIQWHEIQTTGVSTNQAISNIKSYLYTNKAVTLGFYLPDFTPFWNFWGSNSGNWNSDNYCGLSDGAYPGGHEVTIVGWNDSTDSWIVLNSWGVDSAHPDGTYKLKMDMNYNCANGGYYSYSFGYFDVAFGADTLVPVYRMYSPYVTDHLYTTSYNEYTKGAVNVGYSQEGILGYLYLTKVPGTVPLYRMYSPYVLDHLYTTSYDEYTTGAVNVGYRQEGILGYLYLNSGTTGTSPVYRMYSPYATDHFYTTSYNEYTTSAVNVGYSQEGILGYLYLNSDTTGTSPVYRMYSPYVTAHL